MMKAVHVLLAVGAALSPAAALAAATHLGTFTDWEAYTYAEKNGKVCYMASLPQKKDDHVKARRDTFVSVTHRPAAKASDVVSVDAGYAYKPGSEVQMDIDGRDFKLFTKDDGAWARDAATDAALVEAMRRGSTLIVRGTSDKGQLTTDTYSLSGFTAAYNKISEACGVKK